MLEPRPSDHVITAILEAELMECRKLVDIIFYYSNILVYYSSIIIY